LKTKDEISPKEHLVNEFRLAKGDLEVTYNLQKKINAAIPKNLTIIKELIRREVFPHHYEIYGVTFLELRAAFRAPWAVRSSAVLMEQWGIGISNNKATEIFEIVCRKIGIGNIRIIEYVIEELKEKEDIAAHEDYKKCFESLIDAMDEERKRVIEEMKHPK
jgi:hypothetical protein